MSEKVNITHVPPQKDSFGNYTYYTKGTFGKIEACNKCNTIYHWMDVRYSCPSCGYNHMQRGYAKWVEKEVEVDNPKYDKKLFWWQFWIQPTKKVTVGEWVVS